METFLLVDPDKLSQPYTEIIKYATIVGREDPEGTRARYFDPVQIISLEEDGCSNTDQSPDSMYRALHNENVNVNNTLNSEIVHQVQVSDISSYDVNLALDDKCETVKVATIIRPGDVNVPLKDRENGINTTVRVQKGLVADDINNNDLRNDSCNTDLVTKDMTISELLHDDKSNNFYDKKPSPRTIVIEEIHCDVETIYEVNSAPSIDFGMLDTLDQFEEIVKTETTIIEISYSTTTTTTTATSEFVGELIENIPNSEFESWTITVDKSMDNNQKMVNPLTDFSIQSIQKDTKNLDLRPKKIIIDEEILVERNANNDMLSPKHFDNDIQTVLDLECDISQVCDNSGMGVFETAEVNNTHIMERGLIQDVVEPLKENLLYNPSSLNTDRKDLKQAVKQHASIEELQGFMNSNNSNDSISTTLYWHESSQSLDNSVVEDSSSPGKKIEGAFTLDKSTRDLEPTDQSTSDFVPADQSTTDLEPNSPQTLQSESLETHGNPTISTFSQETAEIQSSASLTPMTQSFNCNYHSSKQINDQLTQKAGNELITEMRNTCITEIPEIDNDGKISFTDVAKSVSEMEEEKLRYSEANIDNSISEDIVETVVVDQQSLVTCSPDFGASIGKELSLDPSVDVNDLIISQDSTKTDEDLTSHSNVSTTLKVKDKNRENVIVGSDVINGFNNNDELLESEDISRRTVEPHYQNSVSDIAGKDTRSKENLDSQTNVDNSGGSLDLVSFDTSKTESKSQELTGTDSEIQELDPCSQFEIVHKVMPQPPSSSSSMNSDEYDFYLPFNIMPTICEEETVTSTNQIKEIGRVTNQSHGNNMSTNQEKDSLKSANCIEEEALTFKDTEFAEIENQIAIQNNNVSNHLRSDQIIYRKTESDDNKLLHPKENVTLQLNETDIKDTYNNNDQEDDNDHAFDNSQVLTVTPTAFRNKHDSGFVELYSSDEEGVYSVVPIDDIDSNKTTEFCNPAVSPEQTNFTESTDNCIVPIDDLAFETPGNAIVVDLTGRTDTDFVRIDSSEFYNFDDSVTLDCDITGDKKDIISQHQNELNKDEDELIIPYSQCPDIVFEDSDCEEGESPIDTLSSPERKTKKGKSRIASLLQRYFKRPAVATTSSISTKDYFSPTKNSKNILDTEYEENRQATTSSPLTFRMRMLSLKRKRLADNFFGGRGREMSFSNDDENSSVILTSYTMTENEMDQYFVDSQRMEQSGVPEEISSVTENYPFILRPLTSNDSVNRQLFYTGPEISHVQNNDSSGTNLSTTEKELGSTEYFETSTDQSDVSDRINDSNDKDLQVADAMTIFNTKDISKTDNDDPKSLPDNWTVSVDSTAVEMIDENNNFELDSIPLDDEALEKKTKFQPDIAATQRRLTTLIPKHMLLECDMGCI
ncbi:homeobox-like protein HDP1 [Clytia hemisphaerica]|uniref:Uncharacterized protein n=1 Tax=Clytia hemisphaerica TaxID=252671 RepID=A0A7M5X4I1_9CNID